MIEDGQEAKTEIVGEKVAPRASPASDCAGSKPPTCRHVSAQEISGVPASHRS